MLLVGGPSRRHLDRASSRVSPSPLRRPGAVAGGRAGGRLGERGDQVRDGPPSAPSAHSWNWLNGALQVGDGPGYIELDAPISERIRTEFEARWGPTRTFTSRGWLLRAVNPG